MKEHLLEEEGLVPEMRAKFTRYEVDVVTQRILKDLEWFELPFFLRPLESMQGWR
jgi:hypothetical protein